MTSPTERLVLAVTLGAVLAVCGYYSSLLVASRRRRRRPNRPSQLVAQAKRIPLQELKEAGHCVALCGTVFNVSGDLFFDASRAGIYSSWVGHDVTFLLLQLGLAPEAADDAAAVKRYLAQECAFWNLLGDGEQVKRRRELLKEWYTRFHARYEVVAQLGDRYMGQQWDEIRDSLLPQDGEEAGGKCPLGFGAKTVGNVVSRKSKDMEKTKTVVFQGCRYDVTESNLFQQGALFEHFAGHDITYALAVQSTRLEDLDVTPTRAYTFEEQLLLERYRGFFVRELAVVSDDRGQKQQNGKDRQVCVSLHSIIEHSDTITKEESLEQLQRALETADSKTINELCARTTMAPLHKAVEKNRLDFVRLLVDAGANVEAGAALYDDETPLEMAKRFHFDDLVEYLAASGDHSN